MNPFSGNMTITFYPKGDPRLRLFALWYFCILMTTWWVGGVLILGFEQSWAQFFAGAGTSLVLHYLLMWLHLAGLGRPAPHTSGFVPFLNFMLPAYPTGIACAMLLFPNEQLMPIIFAAAVAISSKGLIRVPVPGGGTQHFFNPSNLGVAITVLLFPWVSISPPYQFTTNVAGVWNWLIPLGILLSGLLVHSLATGRLPLIAAWLAGFIIQGQIRAVFFDSSWLVPLLPMTSVAFALFTLFMIPDPATTPIDKREQVIFGLSIAAVYGVLQSFHVVFGLVLSLLIVCGFRGLWLYISARKEKSGRSDSGEGHQQQPA